MRVTLRQAQAQARLVAEALSQPFRILLFLNADARLCESLRTSRSHMC
jgi:hypothetical protein